MPNLRDAGHNAAIALAVEDIAAAVDELHAKGVTIIADPVVAASEPGDLQTQHHIRLDAHSRHPEAR